MSVLGGNPLLLGGADAAFTTQRSVRLRSSASAYFTRTPASSGNQQKWTWSGWVKRGSLGSVQWLFGSEDNNGVSANYFGLRFVAADQLQIFNYSTGYQLNNQTSQVFRDPSAWNHIVLSVDTTQATDTNRVILYVNGLRVTAYASTLYPSQNTNLNINDASHKLYISAYATAAPSTSAYLDGYLTEINFVDGQALTPSSFGEYDSVRNTQWKPKAYTGTYGTNGFYLKFADNSAATAAALGKDSSGNGNNWTPNNISLTAGVTYDSMTDVPTLTSETASNFATLNPVDSYATGLSQANLNFSNGAGLVYQAFSTIVNPDITANKYYCEVTVDTGYGVCIAPESKTGANSATTRTGVLSYYANGQKYNDTTGTAYGATFTAGDVIGIAMGNGQVEFFKNGASQGVAFSSLTGAYKFGVWAAGAAGAGCSFNFGQRPFTYTPPTGFKALNTFNLPDGAVTSSDDYHKVYTYTGNGGGLQVGEIQKPLSLYNLDRSLRFRTSATGYLSRTAAAPTSAYIWTTSAWIKLGANPSGGTFTILGAGNTTPNWLYNYINSADGTFQFYAPNTGATVNLISSNVFKDPLLWYHVVIAVDTTQATPSNRIKIYVNNVQLTFSTATYPALNATFFWNQNGVVQRIGSITGAGSFDGYMADFYGIDGQALDPTSFGQYDGNYYWTPKAYTGTYGTNGFHLEFKDFSAATAAAIGKDTSGQGNNWTPSAGINLTTPANTNASWDSMVDVPTLTSADVANFCTLNPLAANTSTVPTQGNLYLGNNATNNFACVATLGVVSGKWYWEVKPDSGFAQIGITSLSYLPANITLSQASSLAKAYYGANGQKYDNGTGSAYGATFSSADLIGIALDMDAGTITFYKNGVSQGVAFTGLTGTHYPVIGSPNTYNSGYINFGQRPFQYSNYGTDRPAATFKPINSFNIAEVLGDVESPDFVWIKSRSAGTHHALFNSVTGVGKYLQSSNAVVEVNDVNSLIQFNKNGFLLGNAAIVNTLSATYVASAWKVAATTITNTNGTISSQVRSNSTNGISIVTWTGNNTNNSTIGHGFTSLTPKVIFAKRRDTTGSNWIAMHSALATDNNLFLSGTGLTQAISAISGGGISTTVTPTTFTVKQGTTDQSNVNAAGTTYVAYCFAEIAGFSKFTSYAANASSTDGPFVACGFAPRWIMIKRATGASGTGGWIMYDTSRSRYNVMDEYLFAEGAAGFGTLAAIDVTANGFKIRTNNVHINQTAGDVYIVMAFAEHPFKYALAR